MIHVGYWVGFKFKPSVAQSSNHGCGDLDITISIITISTIGSGGRLANKGGTLSQYVVQTLVVQKEDPYEDNPREAILRHAKVAAERPLYVAPAYKK